MPRARTASVVFILITLLLDTLGIGVIIPVLPRLIESFVGGDMARASNDYGWFVAVYAVMQLVFAPVVGGLSDRFGRRVVILASLLAATLDYLLLAFAPSLAWLFVGRVVAGMTGASFSAGTAYIADVTPPDKRAQSFGLIGVAFGVGFIVGPALGGLVGQWHLRAPFVLAAALNCLNLVYGAFVLPESLRPENRRAFSLARANPFGSMLALTRTPLLRGLVAGAACTFVAQQILQAVWALDGQARFGWTPFDIGVSLAVVGVLTGVVQGGLVRVVIAKLGERATTLVGLAFGAAGFFAFGAATRGWMMYAFLVPFALGGVAGPASQALLSREVSASEQGELQGSLTSLQSLAAIVGPMVGTRLFARFATDAASVRVPGAAYFASALLDVLAVAIVALVFARTPARDHASARLG